MPLFFFNIHDGVDIDGVDIIDPVGTEFTSCEEARVEAIRLAGEVFRNNSKRLAMDEDWYMEGLDE